MTNPENPFYDELKNIVLPTDQIFYISSHGDECVDINKIKLQKNEYVILYSGLIGSHEDRKCYLEKTDYIDFSNIDENVHNTLLNFRSYLVNHALKTNDYANESTKFILLEENDEFNDISLSFCDESFNSGFFPYPIRTLNDDETINSNNGNAMAYSLIYSKHISSGYDKDSIFINIYMSKIIEILREKTNGNGFIVFAPVCRDFINCATVSHEEMPDNYNYGKSFLSGFPIYANISNDKKILTAENMLYIDVNDDEEFINNYKKLDIQINTKLTTWTTSEIRKKIKISKKKKYFDKYENYLNNSNIDFFHNFRLNYYFGGNSNCYKNLNKLLEFCCVNNIKNMYIEEVFRFDIDLLKLVNFDISFEISDQSLMYFEIKKSIENKIIDALWKKIKFPIGKEEFVNYLTSIKNSNEIINKYNNFISENNINTMDGGYKKYLKYKSLYLALKNKNRQFK